MAGPYLKLTGFERPRVDLPENPNLFFGYLLERIREQAFQLISKTDTIEFMRRRTFELLNLANECYGLGVKPEFWHVDANLPIGFGMSQITITVRPRILKDLDVATVIGDNEITAAVVAPLGGSTVSASAPSHIEALVLLGLKAQLLCGLFEKNDPPARGT